MAEDPSLDRIQAWLVQAKLQVTNNPLYQTIFGLLNFSRKIEQNINSSLSDITKIVKGDNPNNKPGGLTGAHYVTYVNDTSVLPQSRVITAGPGIVISIATPEEIIISSSNGGADYVVMSDGSIPPIAMNIGGNFLYVAYTP